MHPTYSSPPPCASHPAGQAVTRVLAAALEAVDPYAAVLRHLRREGDRLWVGEQDLRLSNAIRRVWVVGAGKAGFPMARAAAEVLGETHCRRAGDRQGWARPDRASAGRASRSSRQPTPCRIERGEAGHAAHRRPVGAGRSRRPGALPDLRRRFGADDRPRAGHHPGRPPGADRQRCWPAGRASTRSTPCASTSTWSRAAGWRAGPPRPAWPP